MNTTTKGVLAIVLAAFFFSVVLFPRVYIARAQSLPRSWPAEPDEVRDAERILSQERILSAARTTLLERVCRRVGCSSINYDSDRLVWTEVLGTGQKTSVAPVGSAP